MKIRKGGEEESAEALEEVCRDYWFPLYSFLRLRGEPPESAEDQIQGFFQQLLSRGTLDSVELPDENMETETGSLRSFLLSCLTNYHYKEHRRAIAEKRGGGDLPISFDTAHAELRFANLPKHYRDPREAFDRAWALDLIERATDRVRSEYDSRGKLEIFTELEPLIAWNSKTGESYSEIAIRLGTTEQNVKNGVFRLRKRIRRSIKREIERTIDPKGNISLQDELKEIFSILS